MNGKGVVRFGLLGHVLVLDDSSIHDSPSRSSLVLGVADILLFVPLVLVMDLNIAPLSLSGMRGWMCGWVLP